jgi:hypothetical protein
LCEIAGAWQREHPDLSPTSLFALVEVFWAAGSREERLVALSLLEHYPGRVTALSWVHFDRWRRDLDGRELTDALAQKVFGLWLLANPAYRFRRLWQQLIRGDIWSRRMALIATTRLNRVPEGVSHPGVTLFLVDQVKGTREPVIVEGVVLALQALADACPAVVRAYVDQNPDLLSAQAMRQLEQP